MDKNQKILVVDDEENIRRIFKKGLEKRNYTIHTAQNAEEAIQKIKNQNYLLIFSDIFMGGMSGFDLLKEVKKISPQTKVVVMTAQDTMNNTIEAMRIGAYDYISKPFDFDTIFGLIEKAESSRIVPIPRETEVLLEADKYSVESIVGKTKKMQEIFKTIGKSAASDLAVLITGESGTGKEMVAGAMHYFSTRKDKPFICINCAAISRELLESELFGHEKGSFTGAIEQKKGRFEIAHGGTLFLDEIGDMEIQLQAKILRVLQNKDFYRVGAKTPLKADVRVIAATNQNLEELMEQKRFRDDLFHRLNVIHIKMPPLRDRGQDIILLANYFLKKYSTGINQGGVYLSSETERIFTGYSWRGNIRELENVIKRAVVLIGTGPILSEHLPDHLIEQDQQAIKTKSCFENELNQLIQEYLRKNQEIHNGHIYDNLTQLIDKELFKIMLDKNFGKQVSVAKALGINRNTLKRKINAMKIDVKNYKNTKSP